MDQEELAENEEGKTETEAEHPAKGFDIASDLGNFLLEFGLDPGDFLFEFRLSLDQVRFGGKVGGGDIVIVRIFSQNVARTTELCVFPWTADGWPKTWRPVGVAPGKFGTPRLCPDSILHPEK